VRHCCKEPADEGRDPYDVLELAELEREPVEEDLEPAELDLLTVRQPPIEFLDMSEPAELYLLGELAELDLELELELERDFLEPDEGDLFGDPLEPNDVRELTELDLALDER
jgi:hypothetical protein